MHEGIRKTHAETGEERSVALREIDFPRSILKRKNILMCLLLLTCRPLFRIVSHASATNRVGTHEKAPDCLPDRPLLIAYGRSWKTIDDA